MENIQKNANICTKGNKINCCRLFFCYIISCIVNIHTLNFWKFARRYYKGKKFINVK